MPEETPEWEPGEMPEAAPEERPEGLLGAEGSPEGGAVDAAAWRKTAASSAGIPRAEGVTPD